MLYRIVKAENHIEITQMGEKWRTVKYEISENNRAVVFFTRNHKKKKINNAGQLLKPFNKLFKESLKNKEKYENSTKSS